MSNLPAPLVPADCDLRDFLFTPVEFQRLFSSDTWLMSNDAEKVAALTLWGNSWSQLPAGSMPKDERLLAHISSAGSRWKKVREMAMRGWVLCSDDRYYHPVMCEKALEAWLEKLSQRISSGAGNQARWGVSFDPQAIAAEILNCRALLFALNPKSRALSKKLPRAVLNVIDNDPDGNASGNPDGTAESIPTGSQGTGTGTGNIKPLSPSHDDRLDLPGLSQHHHIEWQPDQPRLATELQRQGVPMPGPESLTKSLRRFNAHHEGKPLTVNQQYAKLADWLEGDHRRENNQRTQAPGQPAPSGQNQPRALTPVERIKAARDKEFQRLGIPIPHESR